VLLVACQAPGPGDGVGSPRASYEAPEHKRLRDNQSHSMDPNDINGLPGLTGRPLALRGPRAVIRGCEDPLMSKAGKS
jgi:hypothetical protein